MKITNPPSFFRIALLHPVARPSRAFLHCAAELEQSFQLTGADGALNYSNYGRLIQLCTDRRLLRQGQQLHVRLVLFSVTPSNFLASKLLTFYAKNGSIDRARKVFDRIPHRNSFSYNAMLIAYSQHDRPVETLRLFLALVKEPSGVAKPDHFTLTCVLKALSSPSFGEGQGREIHCYALRNGFDSDCFVLNALITYYSRSGDISIARMVFDLMGEKKDNVSWNSMISGYSQAGYYEDCLKLYRSMLEVSVLRPDGMTVISVLHACSQLKDLITGMEVHSYVVENDIQLDMSLCNSLLGLYAKCGSLDYARELFEEMDKKDEITYGSLVSGYMLHGYVDQAMNLFRGMKNPALSTWNGLISGLVQNNRHEVALEMMREMQASGLKPNYVTLTSILPGLSYFFYLKGTRQAHSFAIRNNFYQNNIYIATALIDAYAKSGLLHHARLVFDQSSKRSVVLWTAIIAAYSTHGDARQTLSLFHDMLKSGTMPDNVTFTAVLSACAHTGLVDEAWRIFRTMQQEYAIAPTEEHYACMVGVLSRVGKLYEAADFILAMPMEPSPKAWGALLNGASVFGNVEIGRFACSHLFLSEPENTGNYIIMSNLYSRAHRWAEAKVVRQKMDDVRVKKCTGISCIETNGGMECFVARDASNSKIEEIYKTLQGLRMSMEKEGYVSLIGHDEV